MSKQLVYASRSSLERNNKGVDLEVGRILMASKRNNAKIGIGGVLYMDNGYFLQVLEGDPAQVDALYNIICHDERHYDHKILLERTTNRNVFSRWRMNYILDKRKIVQLLGTFGQKRFNPYELKRIDLERLVLMLANGGKVDLPPLAKDTTNHPWFSRFTRLFRRNQV